MKDWNIELFLTNKIPYNLTKMPLRHGQNLSYVLSIPFRTWIGRRFRGEIVTSRGCAKSEIRWSKKMFLPDWIVSTTHLKLAYTLIFFFKTMIHRTTPVDYRPLAGQKHNMQSYVLNPILDFKSISHFVRQPGSSCLIKCGNCMSLKMFWYISYDRM